MGGLAVVVGFFSGIFFILYFIENQYPAMIASCIAVLGACILGIIDDLMELRQRIKGLLPFFFGIPLGIIVADKFIDVPLYGEVHVGFLIIILVPLAITCAANATNMLEGFNGLSVGMNLIMGVTLMIIALGEKRSETIYLLVPLLCALTVFLFFNKYPAKIFPGDTLTLFAGAVIACSAIVSNLYVYALILYIPFILEFFLKFFGKLKRSGLRNWNDTEWAQSFGKVEKGGYLKYEGPTESLTHAAMKSIRLKEYQLVFIFWIIELLFSIVCLVLYFVSRGSWVIW
jgi:UDP-N-acetylglucosamine--dolichyl-phosphate N-acetylglucosaminephosphotransferase